MKILFSWVGHADLLGFAGEYPGVRNLVQTVTAKAASPACGPVKVTLTQHTFDKIILLWNYNAPELMEQYRKYCGEKAELAAIDLSNPTDYRAVYCAAHDVLKSHCTLEDELFFLLSPGTPAMAAVPKLLPLYSA